MPPQLPCGGMHTIVANVVGKARQVARNGRNYLVAPITLIVPGVLNGSEGPLLYPAEEVGKDPQQWDGMPIVVYHPIVNGTPVSARHPDVLARNGVGMLFNTQFTDKLVAEGWFDEADTQRVDPRVRGALLRGEAIEASTGLKLDAVAAPQGSVHNTASGPKPYTHTVHNIRPDHLAVLPDQLGACSIADGCGVNNAETKQDTQGGTMPLTPEQRTALVGYITTNCNCWKWQGAADVLNKIPDDNLTQLHTTVKAEVDAKANPPAPVPTPAVPAPVPTTNTVPAPVPTPAPVAQPIPVAQPLTEEQWLHVAPPRVRAVFNSALEVDTRERNAISNELNAIAANADEPRKSLITSKLAANLSTPELRELLTLVRPLAPVTDPGAPIGGAGYGSWYGAAGGVQNSAVPEESGDVLGLPTWNYDKRAAV